MKTLETTYDPVLEKIYLEDLVSKLSYFQVFKHPIHKKELKNLFVENIDETYLEHILNKLLIQGLIYTQESYYSISKHISEDIRLRKNKEEIAKKYFSKANKYIRRIANFPFVRAISISGSLSKGLMADSGDIDYFIITEKNKLWLARTFLIFYKKVFLLNKRKYFCVNYFVDTDHLEIRDKNIFTASEIAFLLPVYNEELMYSFFHKNQWTEKYYPHFSHPIAWQPIATTSKLKTTLEYIFKGKLGDYLDKYFMKITLKKWQKKFSDFDKGKFELVLRTERGISKHHPRDFQNKVLSEWKENKECLLKKIKY